jgi:NAD(P)-dependent dehydrogenase (short-subunit alcohol dehydrogenase family)
VRLADRIYIVTGAAGGIGLGISEALLNEGARVMLTDLDADAVARAAQHVDPSAQRTATIAADITDSAQVAAVVAATIERFGDLHGLVNNAGLIVMDAAWDATGADWSRQLNVNVTASFLMAQAVAERLRSGHGGAIVNVASNCGKVGYNNMAAYNASKAAVISMTRSLAAEWASDQINVNAVCPGGVDTPMLSAVADWLEPRIAVPAAELLAGMGPAQLGRKVSPLEVGKVIAFLLSDDALIIRGQSISIDGGDSPY